MTRRFRQVDVFTDRLGYGNPLAVVADGDGLDDETMARFARWTNLSETTFLLPPTTPDADYRVRILTTTTEYPFAGHPTLGSAHAWLAAGGVPRTPGVVIQECGAGLVPVRVDADHLAFAAPPRTRTGDVEPEIRALVARAIGVPGDEWVACAWGVNGPQWLMIQLRDAAAVRAVDRDLATGMHHVGILGFANEIGVLGFEDAAARHVYEVRAFADGIEDPVTGSLNAAIAQWLRERGLVGADYLAAQGSQVGRAGEISVHDDGTDVWIGGRVATVVSGTVRL